MVSQYWCIIKFSIFDYFIVGEHFKRFLSSGWKGDKYGFPKSQPLGMIWVFLMLFALPWIQLLAVKLWKNKKGIFINKWLIFLLLWLLWTPLFFTVSKSLIHPYIMPVMVPIALLISYWWNEIPHKKRIIGIALIFPVLALLLYITITVSGKKEFYIIHKIIKATSLNALIGKPITDEQDDRTDRKEAQ